MCRETCIRLQPHSVIQISSSAGAAEAAQAKSVANVSYPKESLVEEESMWHSGKEGSRRVEQNQEWDIMESGRVEWG